MGPICPRSELRLLLHAWFPIVFQFMEWFKKSRHFLSFANIEQNLFDRHREILEVLLLEKSTHTFHDEVKGFVKIWKPVFDMVDPSGMDFPLPD